MSGELNFVRQQGFPKDAPDTCAARYPALMWQPRVIGVVVLSLVALQWAPGFLALGALLWWNAAVPSLNPFDALYNALVAHPKGRPPLPAAPAPRRFSQVMAGTFMLAIGSCLLAGRPAAAWILEGLLLAALVALVFGRFCLGSYLFHLATGDAAFANRTLPWTPAE